jgi:multidrug efflux pump subunit AcrA (membrane-fusion protein)
MSLRCYSVLTATACLFAQAPPIPVEVQKPNRVERGAEVRASGSVEPRESVETGFQVAGRIARVLAEEGQTVRKGQLLAELDAADYRHGYEAAQAQTAAARAQAGKAVAGARPEEVALAKIRFEQAEDEYRRMRILFERKSLAPNDFRKIEAAYLAAREQYRMATTGTRPEDIEAAKAAVQQAEAGEAVARKRVEDTRLVAPISGVVARRLMDAGESVAAGMPVFAILDLDPVRVRVGVPEAEIGGVRAGQQALVQVPDVAPEPFQGKVELIGPAAESASRTFPVRVLVPNPGQRLKAGMIAEARILTARIATVTTLPGSAIVRDPQGATMVWVYFPAQKRVYARRVSAGTVYGGEVEIRAGLKGDELVVTAGQNRLFEGAQVESKTRAAQ